MRSRVLLLVTATAAMATFALAGCTTSNDTSPDQTPPSTSIPSTGPVGPVAPAATSCLSGALVAGATGQSVTAATDEQAPPAGPIDAALVGTARILCSYDLADGSTVGFTPLVKVSDVSAVDAAIFDIVGHDDCTLASGYLVSGNDAYYVWTGEEFSAAYLLAGDATDPEAWLAKLVDAAGLCGGGDQ